MHSVFYSDLRRAINNRYVKMGAIVSVVYPLVYFLSYLLILKIAKLDVQIYGDDILHKICKDNGVLSTPDECFRFMSELPNKYTHYGSQTER